MRFKIQNANNLHLDPKCVGGYDVNLNHIFGSSFFEGEEMGSSGSKATSSSSTTTTTKSLSSSSGGGSGRRGRSKGHRVFQSACLGTTSRSHDSDNDDQARSFSLQSPLFSCPFVVLFLLEHCSS